MIANYTLESIKDCIQNEILGDRCFLILNEDMFHDDEFIRVLNDNGIDVFMTGNGVQFLVFRHEQADYIEVASELFLNLCCSYFGDRHVPRPRRANPKSLTETINTAVRALLNTRNYDCQRGSAVRTSLDDLGICIWREDNPTEAKTIPELMEEIYQVYEEDEQIKKETAEPSELDKFLMSFTKDSKGEI